MNELIELLKSFDQNRDGVNGYVFTKNLPDNQGIVAVHTKMHTSICTLEIMCPAYHMSKILKELQEINQNIKN